MRFRSSLHDGNQEVAVNQIDNAIRKTGREVRPEVERAVLAQAPRRKHARITLTDRQLDVGIRLVVAQKNVVARLLLLDQIVLERQRFLLVVDHDVVEIDGLAQQGPCLGVLGGAFQKVRPHPRAQVVRLAHVDDLALGVFVQIHAGRGRKSADFLVKIHAGSAGAENAGHQPLGVCAERYNFVLDKNSTPGVRSSLLPAPVWSKDASQRNCLSPD